MKVIADDLIDPNFGTGVAKVTPAHDMKDFEIGKKHNLPIIKVIDFSGRLNEVAGRYKGLSVKRAREKVAQDLEKKGLIFSGISPDRRLMEIAELPKKVHPFFVGTQFHPEFKSWPLQPHPLFIAFIRAAMKR